MLLSYGISKMNLKWKLKISQIATVQDVLNYIENGRIYFKYAAF
jgi:hypothetical protein